VYYFILNPVAGGGKLQSIQHKLKQKLSSLNLVGEFMKTAGDNDAENLARLAVKKGYSTIICVGGDSTVNEVLNGISGADITLGIIPIGYNNVFADLIKIPNDWRKAIDVIAARRIEHFDLGNVLENKEFFIMSSGIGAENVLSIKNRNRSFLSDDNFLGNDSSFFANLLKDQPTYKLQFVIDRKYAITSNALSVSIINSRFFKYGYLDNIEFDYKDRMLDLVILSNVKNRNKLKSIIKNSSSLDGKYFTHIRGTEIHVESFSEQLKVHLDGRVLAKTPCTFKISPTKQKIITSKR